MPAPIPGPGSRRRIPAAALRPDTRTDPDTGIFPDDGPDPDADAAELASAAAAEILRWSAFACVLVPVTLLTCGTSPNTALGTAVGLAVVTAVCRTLLRRSERTYAQQTYGRFAACRPGPHRGRHSRTGTGLHRGGRHPGHPGQP